MPSLQKRTRKVVVRLSPSAYQKLEELAERFGGLTHSSVLSLAIMRLAHSEGLKKKTNGQEATR